MWLPRGLSAVREHVWVGNHHGVPSQETGGSGSGCGGIFFEMRPTQHSNVCNTQVPEHSGGSGLDHESRLRWRVLHVRELCLSIVAVERYRQESRAVVVESF